MWPAHRQRSWGTRNFLLRQSAREWPQFQFPAGSGRWASLLLPEFADSVSSNRKLSVPCAPTWAEHTNLKSYGPCDLRHLSLRLFSCCCHAYLSEKGRILVYTYNIHCDTDGMDGWRSIPGRSKIFSPLHRVQTWSRAHPASYPWVPEALFAGVKRPGREANHSPRSGMVELYFHSCVFIKHGYVSFLTFKSSAFCPQSASACSVWFSQ
jgi:hypothetical protein